MIILRWVLSLRVQFILAPSRTFTHEVHVHPSIVAGSARFKAFRKYVYQYTAESRNGVVGGANLRNGPKVFCQVPATVDHSNNIVSPRS